MTPDEFEALKSDLTEDWLALHDWREEAREAFGFYAGEQYTEAEKQEYKVIGRIPVVFNRTGPIIDNVAGTEVKARSEIAFLPRELGDAHTNEILTGAGDWFRDEADAETMESDAFTDAIICGLGWTDTRLAVDDNPEGDPFMERIDPVEMGFDRHAVGRNLRDARRVFRVRQITKEAAREIAGEKADDADLDASWIGVGEGSRERSGPIDDYNAEDDYSDGRPRDKKLVTVVQVQWKRRIQMWMAEERDPATGQMQTHEVDAKRKAAIEKLMPGVEFTPFKRWEYRQAFLGAKVLKEGPAAIQSGFTFQAITGKRDRNRKMFYGLMRAMKDPQKWHNRFMSMMMHVLASNSKGGFIAEEGLTKDHSRFETEWSQPASASWVPDGSLSGTAGPRLQPKPQTQLPAGYERLMMMAQDAITDATGVNAEMIGLKDVNQSGVLEYQRREAAMTVLAGLFDGLRSYRKRHGRVLLEYLTKYLSDGRLIRIVGEDGKKYLPLVRQEGVEEYDVIVDEATSSPNAKERAWAAIKDLIPILGPQLGRAEWLELAKYSPLPSSLVEKLSAEAEQEQPDPMAQQMQQMQMQAMQAEIQKTAAEAAKMQAEAQVAGQGAAAEIAYDVARAQKADAETAIMRSPSSPKEVVV